MTEARFCPIPMPDGSDCWRSPAPDGFAHICTEHMMKIAEVWIDPPRSLRRARCHACGGNNIARDRMTHVEFCLGCEAPVVYEVQAARNTEPDQVRHPEHMLPRKRTDVVYYLQFGDRVKIGTTTTLPKRLMQIPHDMLLAIEPGDRVKERSRHTQFRHLLVPDQREWFHTDPDLTSHISAIRAQFGPPMHAWKRWENRA